MAGAASSSSLTQPSWPTGAKSHCSLGTAHHRGCSARQCRSGAAISSPSPENRPAPKKTRPGSLSPSPKPALTNRSRLKPVRSPPPRYHVPRSPLPLLMVRSRRIVKTSIRRYIPINTHYCVIMSVQEYPMFSEHNISMEHLPEEIHTKPEQMNIYQRT